MPYATPTELTDLGITVEELNARARMKPQFLLDMIWMHEGREPATEAQRKFRDWLHNDPQKFTAQMRAALKDYGDLMVRFAEADALAKRAETEKASAVEVADEGAVKVEDLIGKLLGDAVL